MAETPQKNITNESEQLEKSHSSAVNDEKQNEEDEIQNEEVENLSIAVNDEHDDTEPEPELSINSIRDNENDRSDQGLDEINPSKSSTKKYL